MKRIIISIIAVACIFICMGCNNNLQKENNTSKTEWNNLSRTSGMDLQYASQFAVDYYEGGYKLITIAKQSRYLVIPKGKQIPSGLEDDIQPIKLPVENIYLAASSVMDFFYKTDALNFIKMTGTKPEDWSNKAVREKVSCGEIQYAGKYSAPDYEMIVDNNCDLAIESTMIFHSPEVKEQLERMGITTLVDYSSYESHPLGRVEWIKLYGMLSEKEAVADAFMEQCVREYNDVVSKVQRGKKKTVAFFYINSAGNAVVRKPGDYITKMISTAGGKYVFEDILGEKENAMSTMNMQMESFYESAVDADVLIYNSTIDGEIDNIEQLVEKNELLSDFKAVKEGNVWCTSKNMYQEITGTSQMIKDFYSILNSDVEDTTYIHKLR